MIFFQEMPGFYDGEINPVQCLGMAWGFFLGALILWTWDEWHERVRAHFTKGRKDGTPK